ncbi:MAG TPA: hypothetical protein VHY79_18130 [Rhizomicrobium sp.]|nr:hypothetical protein [Rhizomicrobium sp.]
MSRFLPGAALVVWTLAGCAGGDPALRKNPSFQEGYEDGCQAATDQGADLRDRTVGDKQLLKSDDAYRAGYSNGLSMCRRTNSEAGTLPGTNPPLVPGPGGGH